MGICSDQATTYLRRLGYNVVRHPREGINPLDIIGIQKGETLQLGTIDQLIAERPTALPAIKRDEVAGDIQGQASSKLNAAIGLNLLKAALSALGGTVGVNIGYQNAKTIQFVFERVVSDSVEPLAVGNYLKAATVDVDNVLLKNYVLGNGKLFLITRTAKTDKFTVKADASNQSSPALDVPVINGVASGSLKVSTAEADASTVSYEGAKKLVFGFQCFEIGVADGILTLVAARAGATALEMTAVQQSPAIIDEGSLLDLGP